MTTQLSPARPVARSRALPEAATGPQPEAAIRLCALTKRFVARQSVAERVRNRWRRQLATAVDGASFEVMPGEIFGLLGPNGAGKTTIFKMLSTMMLPDEGTAVIHGYDVVREGDCVRQIVAAVPADERSLNWRLTALENLRLFAVLNRLDRSEAAPRIDSLLRTVGLSDTGAKLVGSFSSGMRQRLLIARALLGNPQVLLLDEPTRSLDPISAHEFREFLLHELVTGARCTIMLATHNASEAFGFCDRVAVLHQGHVLATGAARDLAARYGEERYRVVTRTPGHQAFARLELGGLLRLAGVSGERPEEWTAVECIIEGGARNSSRVISLLVAAGVDVALVERVEPSLADLISRIIAVPTEATHA